MTCEHPEMLARGCQRLSGLWCCSGKLLKEKTVELSSVEHYFWWRNGLLEDLDGKISVVPEFREPL